MAWMHRYALLVLAAVLQAQAAGADRCGIASCSTPYDKVAASAHRPVFYDNNFDYLCDPCGSEWYLGDRFKRVGISPWLTVDAGGQYRARLHSERNIRGLGLTGRDDDFLLHRTRLYVNAEFGDRVRFYGEMIDAVSEYENFAPRSIEENRADLLNLFIDVVAWQGCGDEQLTVRLGRQELIYGSQRLVSPLDWGNTRRPFEGAKLMWEGTSWDVDAFWVRPLRTDLHELDAPDLDQEFYGVYGKHSAAAVGNLDLYWLAYDHHQQDFRYDTLGARIWGDVDAWLYELEGGYQFGDDPDGSSHDAAFFTAGLGRSFECTAGRPTVWLYYDYASGDAGGNGFHHFFPLGHKYLGFMDLFGRRNIQDLNVQATVQVCHRLQLLAWWHYFWLADGSDVLYTPTMAPFTASPTGSQELGHELDLVATYVISPRAELLLGYSHFFAGDYYRTTAGLPYNGDADFFYTQFTVNF